MVNLPRGLVSSQTPGAPVATARWASVSEIEKYRYREGDIYLGITRGPHESALPLLRRMEDFQAEILTDQDIPDVNWKQTVSERITAYRAALMTTNRVPIGSRDDRHLLTKAGTRSGKGISAILPNLMLYPGSILTIDPKGANARITASRRADGSGFCKGLGQKTYVLDPYNVSRVDHRFIAAFNPLDLLKDGDETVIDTAASIADALVVKSGTSDNAHFDESARILIKSIILFVALNEEIGSDNQNLGFVHRLLCRGTKETSLARKEFDGPENPDPFRHLLRLMELETRHDGVIAGIAATMLDMGDREYGSVLSTARRNLEFLERPCIRRSLSKSTFSFSELKADPKGVSIFLCLPVTRMADTGRWLRLMVASALESIYAEAAPPKCGHPIVMLLEEFAVLGHMQTIETAAGFAAEFGLKLWCILHDLPQLKRHYPQGWETFMANSGVIQAFGNGDVTTLEYLSKKLGETEVIQTTHSQTASLAASSNDVGEFNRMNALLQNRGALTLANPLMLLMGRQTEGKTATSTNASSTQIQRSPLLLPDEIERYFAREHMTEIIAFKGDRPAALTREAYYETPEFFGLFDPDRPAPFKTLAEAEQERAEGLARLMADAEAYLRAAIEAFATARSKGKKR